MLCWRVLAAFAAAVVALKLVDVLPLKLENPLSRSVPLYLPTVSISPTPPLAVSLCLLSSREIMMFIAA